MSVKERVIGIVMNRPAKPDPQDVPLGIQQLIQSGVPFIVSPNPNLMYEGIEPIAAESAATMIQAHDLAMAKTILRANPAYVETVVQPEAEIVAAIAAGRVITSPVELTSKELGDAVVAWEAQYKGSKPAPEYVYPDGDSWATVAPPELTPEESMIANTLVPEADTAEFAMGGEAPPGTPMPVVGEQVTDCVLPRAVADKYSAYVPDPLEWTGGADVVDVSAPEDKRLWDMYTTPLVPSTTFGADKDATEEWAEYSTYKAANPGLVNSVPKSSWQDVMDSASWARHPKFTTYTAPPEPRTIGLTPAQIAALDAVGMGCSVQVMNKLNELGADLAAISRRLALMNIKIGNY